MYDIFIAANPFLVALTPSVIEVNFSDPLTLFFQAAHDSNGIINSVMLLTLEHTSIDGIETNYTVQQNRSSSNMQIFSITFDEATGNLAGTFDACKSM